MSRIGKQPVVIPNGVQVKVDGLVVHAKGPKGEFREILHPYVKAEIKDGRVLMSADLAAAKDASAIWGMMRARVNNLVQGVTLGYAKKLEIHGLGFRAEVAGQKPEVTDQVWAESAGQIGQIITISVVIPGSC